MHALPKLGRQKEGGGMETVGQLASLELGHQTAQALTNTTDDVFGVKAGNEPVKWANKQETQKGLKANGTLDKDEETNT